jgi:hypothetical protein
MNVKLISLPNCKTSPKFDKHGSNACQLASASGRIAFGDDGTNERNGTCPARLSKTS